MPTWGILELLHSPGRVEQELGSEAACSSKAACIRLQQQQRPPPAPTSFRDKKSCSRTDVHNATMVGNTGHRGNHVLPSDADHRVKIWSRVTPGTPQEGAGVVGESSTRGESSLCDACRCMRLCIFLQARLRTRCLVFRAVASFIS